MKILIDGDIELYKACCAVEELYTWEEDLHTLVSDSREARQRMEINIHEHEATIKKWLPGPYSIVLCFSGPNNWRKRTFPGYKASRVGRKPIAFKPLKDWFIKNWNATVWEGLEADDVCAILSTTDENDCIIVSSDKDLKSVPGYLYNPDKDISPRLIAKVDADWFHAYQTLMGDAVDEYPGCPGIGPVRASKLLGEPGRVSTPEIWERIREAYTKAGKDMAYLESQAKVARILRKGEWDFDKKECLWKMP